jgi:hypothetical protein
MLILGTVTSTAAEPKKGPNSSPPQVTGVYSNMRFATEDVSGVEIFLLNSDDGYFALLQCAEGVVSKPVLLPATVSGPLLYPDGFKGYELEIQAHSDSASHCPKAKFRGVIRAPGLKGHFDGTEYPGILSRRRSYWQ